MSSNNYSMRPPNRYGRHIATTPSPLRHASTASTNSSSSESNYSNPFPPSRTSTVSSNGSNGYPQALAGHKRGLSDLSPVKSDQLDFGNYTTSRSSFQPAKPQRDSLRTLPQAPASKSRSVEFTDHESDNMALQLPQANATSVSEPQKKRPYSMALSRTGSMRGAPHVEKDDFQKLGQSTTSHLRALSKFAEAGDKDFQITSLDQEVVGLHGRRRLQRNMSVKGNKSSSAPGYGGRIWMDQQRQFLQAYEYLCHIGEAKEWIEDITHKPIPPIVQLEEALRDGVTLAEVVQVLQPEKSYRIFRNPKLQFRHSDNIAIFFRYLATVELPELFRFELVDLYEKKNIPKVIYCIHALSWLLFRKGVVDFRIGNLVGKLEFEDHELEATQKGLDKAGVAMPNFSGMGANFGAEPEPEPVETEAERQDRELLEHECAIVDLQAQLRGALLRFQLADSMQELWAEEELLINLQARIRGDFARQISDYRLLMQQFATDLQRFVRGYIARNSQQRTAEFWRSKEPQVIILQSLIRSRKARCDAGQLRSKLQKSEHGVRDIQAVIRGSLLRTRADQQCQQTKNAEGSVQKLQALIRGFLQRYEHENRVNDLQMQQAAIHNLQCLARGRLARDQYRTTKRVLESTSKDWSDIQSKARGAIVRKRLDADYAEMSMERSAVIKLQAIARAMCIRKEVNCRHLELQQQERSIIMTQSVILGFLQRRSIQSDSRSLLSYRHTFTTLQGLCRGYNCRKQTQTLRQKLAEHATVLVELQSSLRGVSARIHVSELLDQLENEEESIAMLQAIARGHLVRGCFAAKKKFYDENMNKVIKLQSFVRAKQQGEAYKSLMSGKNPPVGTVKNFVHLLNDSDFDFEEEIESERVRKTVVQRVRQNELMEQYIEELDTKIGLVQNLKNRRDEFVRLQKHHGGHIGNLLSSNRDMSSRNTLNFKALNKSSREKVEQYQELFFVLQTQPQYLARLFRRLRERGTSDEECKRLETLAMSMFGFAQKRREEYYLLKLIIKSVKEEVDGCASLQEYLRGNFFWTRLFGNYTRSPKDRKFLRELFGSFIKTRIVEDTELDLESDPLQIYRSAISNEELRTGHRSQRNPDIPREEAIRDPETRETFIHHLQDLRDISDSFLKSLDEMVNRLPYSVRYVAQQMFETLCARFPDEHRGHVLQVVGNWLWKTYLKPAVTDPEALGIVDRGLSFIHKRNLGECAKVISQVASGRSFGDDNVYLQPLNSYVTEAMRRLEDLWLQMIDVRDAETHFDIDEFNDHYARNKPTLFIKLSDVFAIHQTVVSEISYICASHEDSVLREIVHELGSAKANETEMSAGNSTEITLQLTPKLHDVEDPEGPIKTMFMETKRCVLYIIRIQSGNNLLEIMVKPVTPDDEYRWEALIKEELAADSRNRGAYADAKSLIDIASLSYPELKRIALENILALERSSRLSRSNHYQDLLNEIAVDIRTKHRRRVQRQRELESVRLTLANLDEKSVWLEDRLKAYNDAFEQNLTTLQNKKGKKRFLMPFSKQWDHERELARMGKTPKFGSFKYSAEALWEKGILVEWSGMNGRENDLILSSDEIGVFHIEGSQGSMMIPGASATFTWDDMLAAQYNNQQYLTFFGDAGGSAYGTLKVNANLLQTQVSKKFWRND